mmetsp:Transcript_10712/g.19063  ORF Transcript_10712/g.19063 Transcript_10712/m.19063 type:complete len:346 (+) Transcript_10712:1616-2653(+)
MEHHPHIPELPLDGESHRGVSVRLSHWEGVERLQEAGAIEPWAHILAQPLAEVDTVQARDGHELIGPLRVPCTPQERVQLVHNFVIPFLGPLDGRVVHLVDGHHQIPDPGGLREDGVLPGLAPLLKPCLKLPLPGGNDQHADVGLAGPPDHGGDEGLVSGCVQDGVAAAFGFEIARAGLVRLPLVTLLIPDIHGPRVLPRLTVLLLGLTLEFLQGPLVHHARGVQQVPTDGGLPSINVPNEDQVQVGPGVTDQFFLFLGRLLLLGLLGVVFWFIVGLSIWSCVLLLLPFVCCGGAGLSCSWGWSGFLRLCLRCTGRFLRSLLRLGLPVILFRCSRRRRGCGCRCG